MATTSTKKTAKPATTKLRAKKAKPAAKNLSQIDAAVLVLADAGEPMNCKAMIEAMQANGYWTSPGGKTPAQTLYASLLRDLANGQAIRPHSHQVSCQPPRDTVSRIHFLETESRTSVTRARSASPRTDMPPEAPTRPTVGLAA